MRARSVLAMGVVMAVLWVGTASAIEQKPLPAFRVYGADGQAVFSAQLPVPDQWLLIFVAPGCRSCDLLLASLKSWESPQLLQHTIIIVGGPTASAQSYIQRVLPPEVSAIPWYADAGGEAWAALGLTGTPVLVGVNKHMIQWAISGVLNDPAALESVVKTWVSQ
jgi:hypothetical protein